ncbi:TetR/AcrR family transcriptional regulator [Gordonibacter sp.]|uniref:TetR/AcrR family transcriptional regulator n=1 Tax=Gordonibacter sp. TaxID=1968902 RepID=UPI002FC7E955
MARENTKERILEEAFALFAERGYHAVSMRDIAAAVGIKDASLYNHFPGKQALFEAILEGAIQRLRSHFEPRGVLVCVEDDKGAYERLSLEGLTDLVLATFQPFFEDSFIVRLRRLLVISQFESEMAAQAYRLVFVERPLALQRTVFEHLMATGEFVRDDAVQMAVEFYGPVFLLLHAGVPWGEAAPRIAAHLAQFAGTRREGCGEEKDAVSKDSSATSASDSNKESRVS